MNLEHPELCAVTQRKTTLMTGLESPAQVHVANARKQISQGILWLAIMLHDDITNA